MKKLSSIKRILVGVCAGVVLMTSIPSKALAVENSNGTTTTTTTVVTTPNDDGSTTTTTYSSTSTTTITDDDRFYADQELLNHFNSLKIRYALENAKNLDEIFNSAVYYIAYTEMTKEQLNSYVASVKTQMSQAAESSAYSATAQYLQVADNWTTPTVSYGQNVSIVLPIINLGQEELKDIVIEPIISTDIKEWPFNPGQTGYAQTEPFIPGYINDDHAFKNRREFTYNFTVRPDVMTGFYALKFRVSYTRAGIRVEDDKAAVLSVYVHTIGKPESGYIGGNGNEDKAKSRIIVTGYETDVEKVFSGDTFNLTIHVQNTSADSTVTNILFGLTSEETTTSGTTSETITPFLPTSGSNSVYIDKLGPKESHDINIEMSAKAGLAQRSYPLKLEMTYDSGTQFDVTGKDSISIPVYQESKFDMSNIEVTPASINVGSQSNVMFSIYNTGKTTLYNVQVTFNGDSIDSNMAFVGNLTSGSTGNVDIMLTGVSPTMDDGTVNMQISYEDEAGNVTTVEKTCTLFVNAMELDMGTNTGMREPPVEEKDNSALIRALIIIAILVVIVAVIFIVIHIKKKKREELLRNDDLKDLEILDDNNDDSDED